MQVIMCINIVNTREASELLGFGSAISCHVQSSIYLVFSLSVNVSDGGVGVKGGVGMVPPNDTVPSGSQCFRGLCLRHWVHLALQPCTETIAGLRCTNLLRKPPDG